MTAPAVRADGSPPAPLQVPAVASLALEPVLNGPVRRGRVLGTSRHAAWVGLDRDVLVLSTRDAVRLSISVEMAVGIASDPFGHLCHGADVVVGDGRVVVSGTSAMVVRWWDPHPALPPAVPEEVAVRIDGLTDRVGGIEGGPLASAIAARDAVSLIAAARRSIGNGPGLTPIGDDYLAGAIAAIACLAPSMRRRRALTMLDAAEAPIAAIAGVRTTAFSASILRHSFAGSVAAPAGAFLRACAGRGDVAAAHRRLLDVGSTSGPALAAGIVLGSRALIQGDDT